MKDFDPSMYLKGNLRGIMPLALYQFTIIFILLSLLPANKRTAYRPGDGCWRSMNVCLVLAGMFF